MNLLLIEKSMILLIIVKF